MTFFEPSRKGFDCINLENKLITFDELIFELDTTHNSKYVLVPRIDDDYDDLGYIVSGNIKYYVYYYTTFINTLKMTYTILNRISYIELCKTYCSWAKIVEYDDKDFSHADFIFYQNITLLIKTGSNIQYHLKPEYEKEIVSCIKSEINKFK